MGDLDLYQRKDALPHTYTLDCDEPLYAGLQVTPAPSEFAYYSKVSAIELALLDDVLRPPD
ncbi:hypothetical protein [Pseudoclavibacter helvolus]|uniref:hypothetical protein n=1 Tax=Pseudoclavibacter helvolus TaxID=255205 RepID=UPI0008399186|nr:hypothetical protein [Pseudoclavibacter helvolus]